MLAEHRQAIGQRVAARINDPRVGQDRENQADMHPVRPLLIEKMGAVGAPLGGGTRQIVRPQRTEPIRPAVGEAFRIADRARLAAMIERLRDQAKLGQFLHALDLGVRRQYLLDQRRPAARHAEDEDGRVGRIAHVLMPGQKLGREHRDGAIDQFRGGNGRHFGMDAQPLGVRDAIRLHGRTIVTAILQRAGQREIQVTPILPRRRIRSEERADRRNVFVVERADLHVGELPPGLAQMRHQLDDSAIGGGRILGTAQGPHRVAIGEQQIGAARMRAGERRVDRDRIGHIPPPDKCGCSQAEIVQLARCGAQQVIGLGQRLIKLPLRQEHHGKAIARVGEGRHDFQRARQGRFRRAELAGHQRNLAAQMQRRGIVGIAAEMLVEHELRRGKITPRD